ASRQLDRARLHNERERRRPVIVHTGGEETLRCPHEGTRCCGQEHDDGQNGESGNARGSTGPREVFGGFEGDWFNLAAEHLYGAIHKRFGRIASTPLRKVEQVDEAISELRLTLADLNGNASGRRARKYPKQSQHRDTDEVSEKPRADGRHDPEQGGAWTGP